jgi:hypothetical protein
MPSRCPRLPVPGSFRTRSTKLILRTAMPDSDPSGQPFHASRDSAQPLLCTIGGVYVARIYQS